MSLPRSIAWREIEVNHLYRIAPRSGITYRYHHCVMHVLQKRRPVREQDSRAWVQAINVKIYTNEYLDELINGETWRVYLDAIIRVEPLGSVFDEVPL